MNLKVKYFAIIISIVFSNFAATQILAGDFDKNDPNKVIKVAPSAPVFTDVERQTELATRRKKVADAMDDNSMLILFSADSKLYTNDVDYIYRQENNLYYLTALKQNGVFFVMTKNGGVVKETLFLPKRNPQFETWNGRMYSNEDATQLSGLKTIVDTRYFKDFLKSVKDKQTFSAEDKSYTNSFIPKNLYILQGNSREFANEKEYVESLNGYNMRSATPIFTKLRLTKSPYEIKLMRHAIAITNEGIMRAMGMIDQANWEYEVQAEVEYTFRRRNADFWGYPSIVGCGANATTLHYVESQGKVLNGDLMLMDVGAEYDHYTADITRSFPVSGKFSTEQAEIYKIVYDAQEAAAAKLKPGVTMGEASFAARREIIEGLYKLGLITDKNSNQYRLWFMHGWGHWLGMNVHDVGNGSETLQEGMIMTNEPGIYIREDALDYLEDTPENRAFIAKVKPAFEKYKKIGVRIEDDMLITKTGVKWMSKDLPRKLEDVEAFMAKAKLEMKNYSVLKNEINPTLATNILGFGERVKTREIHSH